MTGPATDNLVPAALDRAREKMIFISPNHRYYPLIADLVSAVGKAWQQGYEQGQRGRKHPNPYAWSRPNE